MRAFVIGVSGLALVGLLACGGGPAADPAASGSGADAAADPRDQFVGTWKLVRFERYDAGGQLLPPPESGAFGAGAPLGYIMYDGEHMGVVIQQEHRKPFAGAQPTGDEAIAAATSYVSYFGPYTVNEAEGYLTHHVLGSNNPGMTGADNQRFYEFSGNELGAKAAARRERRPGAHRLGEDGVQGEHVGGAQRRFLGFWRINYVEQGPPGGDAQPAASQYAAGYIIYMPSGHMAVHLLRTRGPPGVCRRAPDRGRSNCGHRYVRQLCRAVHSASGRRLRAAPPDRRAQPGLGGRRRAAFLRVPRQRAHPDAGAARGGRQPGAALHPLGAPQQPRRGLAASQPRTARPGKPGAGLRGPR